MVVLQFIGDLNKTESGVLQEYKQGQASLGSKRGQGFSGSVFLQRKSRIGRLQGTPEEVSLAQEAQLSRGHVQTSVLQKSEQTVYSYAARSRMYVAHQAYVRRALERAEASRNASNAELESLIDRFIAAHTSSEDHCPAELMEAKHQLNALHQEILNTLAQKI